MITVYHRSRAWQEANRFDAWEEIPPDAEIDLATFVKAAEAESDDPDAVFAAMNGYYNSRTSVRVRRDPAGFAQAHHSTSVGDVLILADGSAVTVARFGFNPCRVVQVERGEG